MKRTAAQRRKDKARNRVRRRHYIVVDPPRGLSADSVVPPTVRHLIPRHKSLEEYFEDMDKALASLPECDRTKENEATLLANIIRDGLGLPALPLRKAKDDGKVHEVQPASGAGNNTGIVPNP